MRARATPVQAWRWWSSSSSEVVGQSWLVRWILIRRPVPVASRGDIVAGENRITWQAMALRRCLDEGIICATVVEPLMLLRGNP
jgi:hypothetical protein